MQQFYEKRRSNLISLLKEENIEKALIGDPITVFYLTGIMLHPYERFMGLFADVNKSEYTMIVPAVDRGCAKDINLNEVVYCDSNGPEPSIIEIVGKCDLLGVDMKYYSMNIGKMISKVSSSITDISDYVSKLRLYKDDMEIEQIQNAARCADEALEEVKPFIKAGVSEKEITFKLYESMGKKPGVITDQFIIQVLGGERSANPHGISGDYVLKDGDSITIDFGAYYNHYWSDFCRTFFVKEIHPKMKEIYDIVLEANKRAISAVEKGKTAKEIDLVARDYITEKGYGELFIHRTGHGIGLDIHEDPYINNTNDTVLEEGMIFTIEPGIYIPNLGGVRIEDDILVTSDGCRVLNTYTKDINDMILK